MILTILNVICFIAKGQLFTDGFSVKTWFLVQNLIKTQIYS